VVVVSSIISSSLSSKFSSSSYSVSAYNASIYCKRFSSFTSKLCKASWINSLYGTFPKTLIPQITSYCSVILLILMLDPIMPELIHSISIQTLSGELGRI